MSSRTRPTCNLPRGSSSLSVHKTSASALAQPKPIKKRKKQEDLVITTEAKPDDASAGSKRSTKRAKLGLHDGGDVSSTPVIKLKPEKKKKTKDLVPEVVKPKRKSGEKEGVIDKKGKKKAAEPVVSKDGDGDEAVEDSEQNPSSSDSGEDDGDYVPPVHESVAGATAPNSTSSSKKNKKYVPPDETPEQRDSRTIFIGNVPSQVMAAKVSRCHIPLLEVFAN